MYQHIVQYYETDKMGITHHSNYVRWMEEARLDYLSQLGWSYKKLEEEGVISPVVAVECKYKNPSTFDDVINIDVWVKEFKGVKLFIGYRMTNESGKVVCEASSEHCFLNEKGMPIRIKRDYPELFETLSNAVRE